MTVPRASIDSLIEQPSLLKQLQLSDWLALVVIAAYSLTFVNYGATMDAYEIGILSLTAPAIIAQGWYWKAFRPM